MENTFNQLLSHGLSLIARNARSLCSVLALAICRGTISRRTVPQRARRSPEDDLLSRLRKIQAAPYRTIFRFQGPPRIML